MNKSEITCQIYGCARTKQPGATVTHNPSGGASPMTFEICGYHETLLSEMAPSMYSTGLTFNNELEIRLHPVVPATPEV